MFVFFLSIIHLTLSQNSIDPSILSDCKRLVLPTRCQCYHSGEQSQLHCHNTRLKSLPKLTNNMRWYALDFSSNNIKSIDSYVFADIYVEKINLKSNYLQTIDLTAFDEIKNLKQLFIDHNQLKGFDPNILTSPGVSLEIFDISYNPLEYLDLGGIFLHSSVLQEFYAVSCQLTNSSLFTLLKLNVHHFHIKIIDLSYNNLTSLCNNLFDHFYNLIELRLNNNNIYLIDNYFIRSLNYIKTLNLALNSIEYLPNLFSSSLEYLNLSSNNIRYLNDYFASNLQSIRLIDFDSNTYLNSILSRSFCFMNILVLEKLSFRFNNILSLNRFDELLCRLLENKNNQPILDLNHNANLTCTQQGQDRYFISKVTNVFSNCTWDVCMKRKKEHLCEWTKAEQLILEGTCQANAVEKENFTKNETELIEATINSTLWETIVYNSTLYYETGRKSFAVLIQRVDFIWVFMLLVLLYI